MPDADPPPDAPASKIVRPASVLFACGQNSIRSPMAAAIARRLFPKSVYTRSAGVRSGEIDPFAIAVMDEAGYNMSGHKPRTFEDLADMSFDLIITLAPEAHHHAMDLTRYYSLDVEYWPTPDPSTEQGSREQILDAYRSVRDGLESRILARLK